MVYIRTLCSYFSFATGSKEASLHCHVKLPFIGKSTKQFEVTVSRQLIYIYVTEYCIDVKVLSLLYFSALETLKTNFTHSFLTRTNSSDVLHCGTHYTIYYCGTHNTYITQCRLYTTQLYAIHYKRIHYTLHTYTLYTTHCTLYTTHLYTTHLYTYTLYTTHLYTIQCTLIHYTLHTYTLYTVHIHYTLHNYTLYNVHYTLHNYTLHTYTLYTVHIHYSPYIYTKCTHCLETTWS